MTYAVELSAQAERDIRNIHDYIRRHGPANADAWKANFSQKLSTLELFPEGCGLASEGARAKQEVRETFFGPFRILFTIDADRVFVLTVRHGARRLMGRSDLDELL